MIAVPSRAPAVAAAPGPPRSRNMEIENLRAAAICLTMFAHLGFTNPVASQWVFQAFPHFQGAAGVDIFFCVSGFIVARSYLEMLDRARAQGRFWITAQMFWLRRAFRLLPTAWLWIAVTTLVCALLADDEHFVPFARVRYEMPRILIFTANFPGVVDVRSPAAQFWSLSLEEQFYFLFPLLLFAVRTARARAGLLIVGIALQFGVERNLFGDDRASLLWRFRTDALLWGILICLFTRTQLYTRIRDELGRVPRWLFIPLNVALIGATGVAHAQAPTQVAFGVIALLSAGLVLLASFDAGIGLRCPGLSAFLAWLGSRSYGIYVLHLLVFKLGAALFDRLAARLDFALDGAWAPLIVLVILLAVAVLAEANFRIVEQPLRRLGARVAARRLARATG